MAGAGPGLHRREVGRTAAAGARPRARAAGAALLALSLGLAACAGSGRRREPPEPPLRLWAPGIVWWTGEGRVFGLEVENGTGRPVKVEAPGPRRVRVVLFAGAERDRVCGHDADASAPPGEAISLAPGEARAVRVDLEEACGTLPPGEYRYEVGYEAPAVGAGPPVRLQTAHGHVVVQGGAPRSLDRGSLGSGGTGGDRPAGRVHGQRR